MEDKDDVIFTKRKITRLDTNEEFDAGIARTDETNDSQESTVTAAKLKSGNWRDNDSLSFVKSEETEAPDAEDDFTTKIMATKDGNIWLIPPEGKSKVNLTEASLTEEERAKIIGYDLHLESSENPHAVTAEQIGLGNVDNTSDLAKPISNATKTALNAKMNYAEGVLIINTQAEWDAMIASPDWLGATSVFIATDLNHTKSWAIPISVKVIDFMGHTITSTLSPTNWLLRYSSDGSVNPTTDDYIIRNLTVNMTINPSSATSYIRILQYVRNVENCNFNITMNTNNRILAPFSYVHNMRNCSLTVVSTNETNNQEGRGVFTVQNFDNISVSMTGYFGTTYCVYGGTNASTVESRATGRRVTVYADIKNSGSANILGITRVTNLSDAIVEVHGNNTANGLFGCNNIVNCMSSAIGGTAGYSFNGINGASNCRQLDTVKSSTAIWTGANTLIDADTCEGHSSTVARVYTQAQFDALLETPNWGGIKSVEVECDLVCTNWSKGVEVPTSVRVIDFKGNKITGAFANYGSNTGLIRQSEDQINSGADCVIKNLYLDVLGTNTTSERIAINRVRVENSSIKLTGIGLHTAIRGIRNSKSVTNCVVSVVNLGGSNLNAYALDTCENITNCSASSHTTWTARAVASCSKVVNTSAVGTVEAPSTGNVGYGFWTCSYCSSCTADGASSTALWYSPHKRNDNSCDL